MQFQNYIVKDGQAVPENAFEMFSGEIHKPSGSPFLTKEWCAFDDWKQSHTYATNAKDGVYTKERFDIVWQFIAKSKRGKHIWLDVPKHLYESRDIKYENFGVDNPTVSTRQFAKLKEEVEKPRESGYYDTNF